MKSYEQSMAAENKRSLLKGYEIPSGQHQASEAKWTQ